MDQTISRRTFMKESAGVVAAASVTAPMILPASAKGANDRINVAVLGLNGRGNNHVKGYMNLENVNVVTLCDPDLMVLKKT